MEEVKQEAPLQLLRAAVDHADIGAIQRLTQEHGVELLAEESSSAFLPCDGVIIVPHTVAHYASSTSQTSVLAHLQSVRPALLKQATTKLGHGIAHFAAAFGSVDTLQYIAQDVDAGLLLTKNESGWNLAHMAAWGGNRDVFEWLWQHTDYRNQLKASYKAGSTQAHFAALGGHVGVLQWLQGQPDLAQQLEAITNNGWTLSHCAARGGHVGVLQWLQGQPDLAQQLQVVYKNGWTLSHCAARNGHVGVLQWLQGQPDLAQQLQVVNKNGWTLSHCAARGGHVGVLQWLQGQPDLAQQLQVVDNNGWTLSHCAARGGHVGVLQWLQGQPDLAQQLEAITNDGWTLSHCAARGGHVGVLQWLQGQPDLAQQLEAITNNGSTLSHCAAQGGHVGVLQWLQGQPAYCEQLQATDNDDCTIAHDCGWRGTVECLEYVASLDASLLLRKCKFNGSDSILGMCEQNTEDRKEAFRQWFAQHPELTCRIPRTSESERLLPQYTGALPRPLQPSMCQALQKLSHLDFSHHSLDDADVLALCQSGVLDGPGDDLTLDLSHIGSLRFMPVEWALRSGPQHTRVRRLFLHGNPRLVFPPPAVASADVSTGGTSSLRYFALLGQELRLPNTRTVAMMGKVGSGKTTLTQVGLQQQRVVLPNMSTWSASQLGTLLHNLSLPARVIRTLLARVGRRGGMRAFEEWLRSSKVVQWTATTGSTQAPTELFGLRQELELEDARNMCRVLRSLVATADAALHGRRYMHVGTVGLNVRTLSWRYTKGGADNKCNQALAQALAGAVRCAICHAPTDHTCALCGLPACDAHGQRAGLLKLFRWQCVLCTGAMHVVVWDLPGEPSYHPLHSHFTAHCEMLVVVVAVVSDSNHSPSSALQPVRPLADLVSEALQYLSQFAAASSASSDHPLRTSLPPVMVALTKCDLADWPSSASVRDPADVLASRVQDALQAKLPQLPLDVLAVGLPLTLDEQQQAVSKAAHTHPSAERFRHALWRRLVASGWKSPVPAALNALTEQLRLLYEDAVQDGRVPFASHIKLSKLALGAVAQSPHQLEPPAALVEATHKQRVGDTLSLLTRMGLLYRLAHPNASGQQYLLHPAQWLCNVLSAFVHDHETGHRLARYRITSNDHDVKDDDDDDDDDDDEEKELLPLFGVHELMRRHAVLRCASPAQVVELVLLLLEMRFAVLYRHTPPQATQATPSQSTVVVDLDVASQTYVTEHKSRLLLLLPWLIPPAVPQRVWSTWTQQQQLERPSLPASRVASFVVYAGCRWHRSSAAVSPYRSCPKRRSVRAFEPALFPRVLHRVLALDSALYDVELRPGWAMLSDVHHKAELVLFRSVDGSLGTALSHDKQPKSCTWGHAISAVVRSLGVKAADADDYAAAAAGKREQSAVALAPEAVALMHVVRRIVHSEVCGGSGVTPLLLLRDDGKEADQNGDDEKVNDDEQEEEAGHSSAAANANANTAEQKQQEVKDKERGRVGAVQWTCSVMCHYCLYRGAFPWRCTHILRPGRLLDAPVDVPCIQPYAPPSAQDLNLYSRTAAYHTQVFLCHHGGDSKHTVAGALAWLLRKVGVRTFWDFADLRHGDNEPQMGLACHQCTCAVVVFSPHFFESKWTVKELQTFAWREKKQSSALIVPLFLQDAPVDACAAQCQPYFGSLKRCMYVKYDPVDSLGSFVSRSFARVLQHPSLGAAWRELDRVSMAQCGGSRASAEPNTFSTLVHQWLEEYSEQATRLQVREKRSLRLSLQTGVELPTFPLSAVVEEEKKDKQ